MDPWVGIDRFYSLVPIPSYAVYYIFASGFFFGGQICRGNSFSAKVRFFAQRAVAFKLGSHVRLFCGLFFRVRLRAWYAFTLHTRCRESEIESVWKCVQAHLGSSQQGSHIFS